jgi:dienelactone hydrolase
MRAFPLASLLLASAVVLAAPISLASGHDGSGSSQQILPAQATRLGATDVTATARADGGVTINGRLDGNQFALAFPKEWKGDGLLYAHGYSPPGSPVAVSADPVDKELATGALGEAYGQGFAVGHSAYAKDGLGAEAGTKATVRLRDLLTEMGGKRIYVMGDSMGGGIVVTLLEMYPKAFVGGFARCGVVASWQDMIGRLFDMRLAYNALTKDTPYALPGNQDVRHDALTSRPSAGTPDAIAKVRVLGEIAKVGMPPLSLWTAAQKDPKGREARVARAVTEIGGFEYDAASLAYPLVIAALGADDMATTAGGWVHGNVGKVYAAPSLTAEENSALNRDIQRVEAAPQAIAYLRKWHTASGRIEVPLVTLHNRIDSLVPHAQEDQLAAAVAQAGRTANLVQFTVPPTRAPLPIGGIEGYTHCGFDKGQTVAAWNALRQWVEQGRKPDAELR